MSAASADFWCTSPAASLQWKLNIIFVWPWTSDSEDQSSISSNRTNKSRRWNLFWNWVSADSRWVSPLKEVAFSVPVSVVWTCRSHIVKTYSYHTLKIKWHSIHPHYLKWSDCFSRQTATKLHSNCGIKGAVKSSVKWNLRAIIYVTLRSSNNFVGQRTF